MKPKLGPGGGDALAASNGPPEPTKRPTTAKPEDKKKAF